MVYLVKYVKVSKKEIGLAVLLAVFVATLAAYTNSPHTNQMLITKSRLTSEESTLRSMWGLPDTSAKVDQQAWQVWETIEGELRQETFEIVVSQLEALTEAKGGYIHSEDLFFRDNLWSGVVSKIPQENTTSFVFGTKALIEANGTVISITTTVRTTVTPDTTEEISYSTIKTTLKETTGVEPPEALTQILSIIPWLVTGLVWIAEGLIIGVPLCFVSLGIIMLVDRGIIPVWKKQLRRSQSS